MRRRAKFCRYCGLPVCKCTLFSALREMAHGRTDEILKLKGFTDKVTPREVTLG